MPPTLEKILSAVLLIGIILLMSGVGVTMEMSKLKQVLKRPVAPILATLLHFLVIPFVCWGLAECFNLNVCPFD